MPKNKKPGFYAVCYGIQTGVYSSWSECKKQINGVPSAVYRKYDTMEKAVWGFQHSCRVYPTFIRKAKIVINFEDEIKDTMGDKGSVQQII